MTTRKGKASKEARLIKLIQEQTMTVQVKLMDAQEELRISQQHLECLRRHLSKPEVSRASTG